MQDERHSEPYLCLNCGNTANMVIRGHNSVVLKKSEDHQYQYQWLQMYDLLECTVCGKPTLRSYMWLEPDGNPENVVYQRHYPPEANAHAALPPEIKRAYLAAERIKPMDSNAYGVLAGRMLELIVKHQGIRKEKLDAALKDMKEKGKIPDAIYSVAEKLKDFRNVGSHAYLGSLSEVEVPILSELCEAIIFHVYVIPSLISTADKTITALRASERMKKGRG